MNDPSPASKRALALVVREAPRDLIAWTSTHRKLVLRVFPDDRALGPADRQLACDLLIMMRTGEDREPPIMRAFIIKRPFVLVPGARLPAGLPRLVARDSYWTAELEKLPDRSAWWVLTQDVEARAEELTSVTPSDAPPAIWMVAAVDRDQRLSVAP
jgi:hypothetical protein